MFISSFVTWFPGGDTVLQALSFVFSHFSK